MLRKRSKFKFFVV